MAWRRRSEQDGAAAVEFALVLPILVLILFGIINFGVIFAQNLALGNGARQAARFGVVEGRTCQDIVDEARQNSSTIAMDGEDVTVTVQRGGLTCTGGGTIPCEDAAANDSVRVELTITSAVLVPFPPMPETIDLEGEGEFRCEFS
jgi:Flp pilus assembly protein TadG